MTKEEAINIIERTYGLDYADCRFIDWFMSRYPRKRNIKKGFEHLYSIYDACHVFKKAHSKPISWR